MVFSFLPVVIWPQNQTTPLYTVVKAAQEPVSSLAESKISGLFKHQLAGGIRGLNQLFCHRCNLVWPKDFLPNLDQSSR